jgi:hypothetical protein
MPVEVCSLSKQETFSESSPLISLSLPLRRNGLSIRRVLSLKTQSTILFFQKTLEYRGILNLHGLADQDPIVFSFVSIL